MFEIKVLKLRSGISYVNTGICCLNATHTEKHDKYITMDEYWCFVNTRTERIRKIRYRRQMFCLFLIKIPRIDEWRQWLGQGCRRKK